MLNASWYIKNENLLNALKTAFISEMTPPRNTSLKKPRNASPGGRIFKDTQAT